MSGRGVQAGYVAQVVRVVAVGSKRHIDRAPEQQQARSLPFGQRIEGVSGVVGRSSLDRYRPAGQHVAVSDVQRVGVHVRAGTARSVVDQGHQVHRASRRVVNRRAGDADVRGQVAAAHCGPWLRLPERISPLDRAGDRVETVHMVGLGHDDEHIADHQRLRVDLPAQVPAEDLPEAGATDRAAVAHRPQLRLRRVPAGAQVVQRGRHVVSARCRHRKPG